jgi:archaemetzincin
MTDVRRAGATLLLVAVLATPSFSVKLPTATERAAAIGPLEGLPEELHRAYDADAFLPVLVPEKTDWLFLHEEKGQTYEDYLEQGWDQPDVLFSTLYLQPIGAFTEESSPDFDKLEQFARIFFGIRTRVLPLEVEAAKSFRRRTPSGETRQQLFARDVTRYLHENRPGDAFCVLAVTMEDLFAKDDWLFIYGQASLRQRVGVFSFARYDPQFFDESRPDNYRSVMLKRSCRVLAHETGHMYGLRHCIYFQCMMNGANHMGESDTQPMFLCPVCLRKLHYAMRFDVVRRYRDLLAFYEEVGFEQESVWLRKRLAAIQGEGVTLPGTGPPRMVEAEAIRFRDELR